MALLEPLSPFQQQAKRMAKWQRRLAGKKKFSHNGKKLQAPISQLDRHMAIA
jgi:hypothetical protein